jgi:hypothetical protein
MACLGECLRRSFAYHDSTGLSSPWTNIEDSKYFWFFRTLTAARVTNLLPSWNSFIAVRLTFRF